MRYLVNMRGIVGVFPVGKGSSIGLTARINSLENIPDITKTSFDASMSSRDSKHVQSGMQFVVESKGSRIRG